RSGVDVPDELPIRGGGPAVRARKAARVVPLTVTALPNAARGSRRLPRSEPAAYISLPYARRRADRSPLRRPRRRARRARGACRRGTAGPGARHARQRRARRWQEAADGGIRRPRRAWSRFVGAVAARGVLDRRWGRGPIVAW